MCAIKVDFSVKELSKGFIVTVGCKTIATHHDLDTVLRELKRYYCNPEAVQKEYFPGDFEHLNQETCAPDRGQSECVPTRRNTI